MKTGRKIILIVIVLLVVAGAIYYGFFRTAREIDLTGTVTADVVIVAPEIQGRLQNLFVNEGDIVTNGELLAQIQPEEWQADTEFYAHSEQQTTADLAQAQADLENARLNF